MTIVGDFIGIFCLALLALAFSLCFSAPKREVRVIERRIVANPETIPARDNVLQFRRRA